MLALCVELKALRNGRWDKAFQKDQESDPEAPLEQRLEENPREDRFRKATIVIEHLIQAADVAHMSQHWNIYRKWNELLYREMYKAYRQGRSSTNPADGWYKGEIGFFDFYSTFVCEQRIMPCVFVCFFSNAPVLFLLLCQLFHCPRN